MRMPPTTRAQAGKMKPFQSMSPSATKPNSMVLERIPLTTNCQESLRGGGQVRRSGRATDRASEPASSTTHRITSENVSRASAVMPRLRTEVGERRTARDEPHGQRRDEIEVEADEHDVDRAMDGAVKHPEHDEDPGGGHVRAVDPLGDEEIQHKRVEEHRDLEQVLQVVGRIGDLWRREPGKGTRHRHLRRGDLVGREEADAPDVHVDPDDERQEDGGEEGTEDRRLPHGVAAYDGAATALSLSTP